MSEFFPQLKLTIGREELSQASGLLNQFLNRYAIPPKTIYNADLVLEEMVGNFIRHGKADGKVGFSVLIRPEELLVTITDSGFPFDPTKFPEPEIPNSSARARIGGLGIHMVRGAAKQMHYERFGEKNRLEIRIEIQEPPNN